MPRSVALLSVCCLLALQVPAAGVPGPSDPEVWIDPNVPTTGGETVPIIVSLEHPPGPSFLDELAGYGDVRHVYTVIDAVHMELPAASIQQLATMEAVTRVDDDAALNWHLDTSRPAIHSGPPVWEAGIDGAPTTVAVVDTGIDEIHPGLDDRVVAAVTFTGGSGGAQELPAGTDADGHGTHVAGIVAGSGERSQLTNSQDRRYAGVANGAQLVSLDISQSFTTSTAIRAFDWIHEHHEEHGITVVQNSWGRKEVGKAFDPQDPAVRASDALVFDDGLLVVFSAANQGPAASSISMEAQNPNVLTVGAVDDSGTVASFSSRGPAVQQDGTPAPWTKPDVAAPGVAIKSAAAGGTVTGSALTSASMYRELSGTSQAAPHVAGIAAMVRAAAPELGPLEVMELLRTSARDLGPPGPDVDTGHGFVDASAALELALAAEDGQLLLPRDEVYEASGELVLGPLDALAETTGDIGVQAARATGIIPVKPNATELDLELAWEPTTPGTTGEGLQLILHTPGGIPHEIPVDGRQARSSLEDPAPGAWTWALQGAEGTAGSISYHITATVTVPTPVIIGGTLTGGGGFFDAPLTQARETVEDLTRGLQEVPGPSAWVAVIAAAMVAVARRRW